TVLTAMAVSMTLGPALMAIFGGLLFRPVPRWLRRQGVTRREGGGRGPGRSPARWNLRTRAARLAAARPMALLISAASVAGLLAAAWGAHTIHLGSPLIRELPASASAARAGAAAADGFAPGILSPTEILVTGPGVAGQTAALARLQHGLATQPGVAEIAGPASLPGSVPVNPMLTASGGAARFVVVENTDPLDATAISRVQQLRHDLPALARAAGLRGVRFELAGQTALTGDSIGSVFAALGLTIGIGQHILGYGSLVYFVPFAAGVLLVSLGSDYNVFVVGRIWEEARRRPVADAVAVATPQASRAITTAGVALAASFAMLAVIPLE